MNPMRHNNEGVYREGEGKIPTIFGPRLCREGRWQKLLRVELETKSYVNKT